MLLSGVLGSSQPSETAPESPRGKGCPVLRGWSRLGMSWRSSQPGLHLSQEKRTTQKGHGPKHMSPDAPAIRATSEGASWACPLRWAPPLQPRGSGCLWVCKCGLGRDRHSFYTSSRTLSPRARPRSCPSGPALGTEDSSLNKPWG